MGSLKGVVNFRLFMECKYIPQKVVFWFDDKNTASAYKWLTTNTPFPERNHFTEQHHYLAQQEKVAKLFSEGKGKTAENEAIYKALTQSLNAMVYSRWQESIIPEKVIGRMAVFSTINMPVIVCNSFDNFYKVEMGGDETLSKITDNFQLEVNYAYIDRNGNHLNEYFLIDVVSFDNLGGYMATMDADFDAMIQILDD